MKENVKRTEEKTLSIEDTLSQLTYTENIEDCVKQECPIVIYQKTSSGSRKAKIPITVKNIEAQAKKCSPPENFYMTWSGIVEMRKDRTAPVDTMGCERLASEDVDVKTRRFQHLVAVFLSSQTNDKVTAACMGRLKDFGLTVDHIKERNEKEIAELMKGVSFHNTKAKNLKKICNILISDYGGDIPDTLEGLCKLPGVGPKMALIAMKSAWNKVEGIAVDVHVHRICNRYDYFAKSRCGRLKWVNTKTPEETCIELHRIIPRDLWEPFNLILVGFGQQICKAVPLCDSCAINDYCPSRQVRKRKCFNSKYSYQKITNPNDQVKSLQ